ncbi:MAG: hypothetical protein JXM73_22445, partial [Anaerolineae bacterium]|nr:hypothetical protein [Anaerolineae bacterium]
MANPPGATSAISATGAAGAAVRDLLEPEPAAQESGSEGPKESKEEPKEKAREAKKTRPVERPGFRWPQVPDRPPAAYARYFGKTWPREGLALALIASGISMRLEAAELVGRRFDVNGRAGSVRRMFERMAKRGLFDSEVVNVGTASAMLLWLTGLGREVCKAVKFPVRETDYERMLRLHGGQRQKEHAGAVVVFAYH